jgi:demethylmenaquinone methyltransferase / 2-methoxy-6-polyprenyl-1,4-benzoquinol methylase
MPSPSPNASPGPNAQSPDRIRGMFHDITPTYDRLNLIFSGALDRRWRQRAAREVLRDLQPCRRLLDVATGTGDLAWTLVRTAERGRIPSPACHTGSGPRNQFEGQLVGVDFTRSMLQCAAQKYRAPGLSWIEADGVHLPLADGAFDAVTIAFGLRNMADKAAALAELARVIRPGGRLAILEFSQPPNPVVRALYDFYSFTVLPRVGRWISGSDAYLYLAESIRSFWSPAELSTQMRQAGLKDLRAIPLMMGIVYLHLGTR